MSGGVVRAKDIIIEDCLDRIYKAWISHKIDDMSMEDQWLLERMEYAEGKLKEGGEGSRFRNLVEDMYEYFRHHDVQKPVTRRTIENDIARAKRFFVIARPREEKEFARGKSIEWLERLIWKAEEAGDFRAAAAFIKELDDIQAFKKEDIERPDYSVLQPPPMMLIIDPSAIGVPVIDDLEEELRLLVIPKNASRNTEQFEDAEDADVSE